MRSVKKNKMSNQTHKSMSLAKPEANALTVKQKVAVALGVLGLLIFALSILNTNFPNKTLFLIASMGMITFGTIMFSNITYLTKLEGIKNDGVWFKSISSRGVLGWATGILLTGFYIVLYFYPQYLGLASKGEPNTGLISLFDPLSRLLSGNPASQWFVYGTLYTLAILVFGYKFMLKYRHNRYEQLRTASVMFFQLGFAFLIPEFMSRLNASPNYNLPYYDLKSMWPLNYYLFDNWSINGLLASGSLGVIMLLFGIVSIFVISPFLTYKYGKRWYCSWVCGCGALAETAGDSFRQLSNKKLSAWKLERWLVHTVLVFSVVMTVALIYTYLGSDPSKFWLTRNAFLISVGIFLTLLFTVIMLFKRKELGKDARYAGIGFFIVIMALLIMHFTGYN